jgi:selenocysteine-specific elongation factor
MHRIILGTAGHIDHGKTALIKSITGIDTDRLEEEKARGISIELGFAHLKLPGGTDLGIVDVPGHERFIKNMLAGVGGIDLVLFVVACDEGIMPQTREHFDIVSLLGVRHGLFALTKSDLVDEDMVELVRDEVEEFIKDTPFEGSPVIPTSVKSEKGLPELLSALEAIVDRIEERTLGEAVRLPVDRVFTITGRGTVVTGTLWSGVIAREDQLVVLPGSKAVRARSVEVHGEEVDKAFAGQRTAIGLHGIEKSVVERGHCVVSQKDFEAGSLVEVEIRLLPGAPVGLKTKARIRFHLGASEVMGRAALIGTQKLAPGESCFAHVVLESPIVAGFGDRFVIRTYSPMRTIGGGTVLDPYASRYRRKDKTLLPRLELLKTEDIGRIVEGYIRAAGFGIRLGVIRVKLSCGIKRLETLVAKLVEQGRVFEPTPGLYLHGDALRDLEKRIEETLKAYQKKQRLTWGMPREELRERLGSVETTFFNWVLSRMEADGKLFIKKGAVRAGSGEVELSPAEEKARSLILGLLTAEPFQPPSEKELAGKAGVPAEAFKKVVTLLIEDGEIVRLEPGIVMHQTAIEEGRGRIVKYLKEHGEATASDLKGVLGTTRKFAVPLLEHLDRAGVTRRSGSMRTLTGA